MGELLHRGERAALRPRCWVDLIHRPIMGAANQICSRQCHQESLPFLALKESQPLRAVSHLTLTDRDLVGANQRPTGERGALLWFRTGSEVVVHQALRLLDVPTAA